MGKSTLIGMLAVVLIIYSLCCEREATAGDILGPELSIYEDTFDQVHPAVAYNWKHDEFLVVWENERTGGVHDIYARRISGSGAVLSQFAISGGDGISRIHPDVDYDPVEDRYLVAYSRELSGGDWDIYGRFIPWAGPDAGLTEFFIGVGFEREDTPKVAYGQGSLIGEQYLVVWWAATSPNATIRGAFVPGDGGFVSTPIDISQAAHNPSLHSLAYNTGRNEFLVVWDYITAQSRKGLAGVILNASGGEVFGGWFQVASEIDDQIRIDAAACSNANQYLVTYSAPLTTYWDLMAQRINGDRTLQGVPFLIQSTANWAFDPRVACFNPADLYLVTWTQGYNINAGPGGVWARTVDTDGTIGDGIEIKGPSPIGDNRAWPVVAAGSPDFFVAWRHQRDAAVSWDIHGRLVRFIPFLDGFESGNTSKWSSKVP